MPAVYRWLMGAAVLALLAGGATLAVLQQTEVAPRVLARYLERRAEGHNSVIVAGAALAARVAILADRGNLVAHWRAQVHAGARADSPVLADGAGLGGGRDILISSVDGLHAAAAAALPGDRMTLLPGNYRLTRSVNLAHSGTPAQPIVLRAPLPGSVTIEVATLQGFVVGGSDWRVENLTIRGSCAKHDDCEHAFHVVGGGMRFTAFNNTIRDFNAHFKVNGENGRFPDHGLIEGNTLENGGVRQVASTVAMIDIVGVNGWVIRRNLIRDFIKGGGDQVSYGAYAKGAGANNLFEQNVVLCESTLQAMPGTRIGLSLGGGGTGAQFCRDGRCIAEQEDSVLRANLVASCSDVGIYLNSAARSTIASNTLLDTAGIDVRYPASAARLDGNLVDGAIRSRNDGVLYLGENRSTSTASLYVGWHPVRHLFADADVLNLEWRGAVPRLPANLLERGFDLCGVSRPVEAAMGAFENVAQCR